MEHTCDCLDRFRAYHQACHTPDSAGLVPFHSKLECVVQLRGHCMADVPSDNRFLSNIVPVFDSLIATIMIYCRGAHGAYMCRSLASKAVCSTHCTRNLTKMSFRTQSVERMILTAWSGRRSRPFSRGRPKYLGPSLASSSTMKASSQVFNLKRLVRMLSTSACAYC
jgi:hypothetical protein